MIKFEGMKAEAGNGGAYPMLPEGPYIAEIKAVKIDGEEPNQSLIIRVDITEGEYKEYFSKRYAMESGKSDSQYPAKYKGDYRLRIPHPQSNSQWPDSDKRKFNDMIFRVEQSNDGFHWDGDERKLIGKKVGINMQLNTFNDKEYTKIGRFEVVEDIRRNMIKPMRHGNPRYSDDYIGTQNTESTGSAAFTPVEDVEIPF